MKSAVEVLPANPQQAQALARIVADAEFLQRYSNALGTPDEYIGRALQSGTLLTALVDGEEAGLVWFVTQGTFGRGGYIRLLAVRSDRRRSGVGRALMSAAESQIFQVSEHAFLLTSDFNASAQRFYESLGYMSVGRIPGYVVPDVDELIYWKGRPASSPPL
ncbi:MAG: GNAT family N-acetyltransferase [Armatimonadetes bacterium]|nr:GNAT family N-acetyltransferase [Armatimonadota bacterium]